MVLHRNLNKNARKHLYSQSRNDVFPNEVAEALGLDPHTFALLEVDFTKGLYHVLLEYIAEEGEDLGNDLIQKSAHSQSSDADCTKSATTGLYDALLPTKEAPRGVVSSLCVLHEQFSTVYDDSIAESECDSEEHKDAESVQADEIATIDEDDINEYFLPENFVPSVRGLRAPAKRKPTCGMGLGFAKVKVDGCCPVYVHHYSLGPPEERLMYRGIALACKEVSSLKKVCEAADDWNVKRNTISKESRKNRYALYRYKTDGHGSGWWSRQESKRSRPLNSVILKKGMLRAIAVDVKEFVSKGVKKWYRENGLPHRRSYLFYGPPGTGK